MMYFGNSRVVLGKNTNDIVYGEWKAVAPNGASNGYYGAVGNTVDNLVNVVAMEWSEIYSTLIFGGLFDNIINGNTNTLEQANSLGVFDGTDIKNLPPTYQGGVTGVAFGSNFNGRVYDIREIKHSTTHYTFLIVGAFSSDGVTSYASATDLHSIAQYSLENNEWIPFGSGLYRYGVHSNPEYSAIRISNLLSDSTGVTAYIFGDFENIRYENNNNQFSAGAVCYRYNDTAPSGGHTAQLIACGGSADPAIGEGVYWTAGHFRNGANGDGKLYLYEGNAQIISVFDTPQSPSTISHVENIDVSDITILPDDDNQYAPIIEIPAADLNKGMGLLSFLERSTVNDNYLYLTGNPVLISTQTSPSTDVDFQVLNTQLIGIESVSSFYNSGYHLPTAKGEIDNGKAILFYNTDTGSFKNVILPEGLDNIYCMAIASDETIYVGGLFQFQDSDGNTACSIAKFIPDASKLP